VILDALDRKFMPVIGMTFLDLDAALCDGTLPVERQVALVQRFSPGAVRGAVATGQISLSDAANSATWSEYYQFRIQALCDEGVPVEVVLQHDLAQVTGRLCEAAVEAEREAERAEARDYQ
jgi:hypothetical protein